LRGSSFPSVLSPYSERDLSCCEGDPPETIPLLLTLARIFLHGERSPSSGDTLSFPEYSFFSVAMKCTFSSLLILAMVRNCFFLPFSCPPGSMHSCGHYSEGCLLSSSFFTAAGRRGLFFFSTPSSPFHRRTEETLPFPRHFPPVLVNGISFLFKGCFESLPLLCVALGGSCY